MQRKIWIIACLAALLWCMGVGNVVVAQSLKGDEKVINTAKSRVGFKAKKMGFVGVKGAFSEYSGKVALEYVADSSGAKVLGIAQLDGVVAVDSVSSGDKTRDEHIRGEVLFNSAKYPKITFTMSKYEPTKVAKNGSFEGKVYGVLQAHGVKKELVLESALLLNADLSYTLSLSGKVDVKKDLQMESYTIMNNTITIDVALVLE